MKINKYQIESKRTCPSLGGEKLDLAHMVLGIFTEFEEYVNCTDDVNRSEECSDIMWYISNYCTFREWDLDDLWKNKNYNGNSFIVNTSILQDIVKKFIAYNKKIDVEKEYNILTGLISNVYDMYDGIDYEKSLENNINKLKVRFPEKFTEENAINRNLEEERKQLEN